MNILEKSILFGKKPLLLTNQRALFWAEQRMLILSDLHVGKAAHFRKSGIALPHQVTEKDLDRLRALITYYEPSSVLIAGDLLHAGVNNEVPMLTKLIASFPKVDFVLVRGNHDRLSSELFSQIGVRVIDEGFQVNGITFSHGHQPALEDAFTICGHYHPGVHVTVGRKSSMRFPCYVITNHRLILPAFSLFSGLDTRCVPQGANCYAIYEDGFFQVSC